jgi:hypothetical protein
MEALRVALAGFTRCVQLRPSERYLWHFLVDTLAARLRSTAPEEVLASVQPVVRAALPPLEREQLLRTLMHAGDPTALEEIEASSDGILVRMPVETVEGERGVRLLVRKLLSAKTGFPNDDTGSVTGCVAAVTRALLERSARERGLALRLLEDHERIDPTIQWALGELPAPEIVPRLGRSMVIEACALDLAPEANRYVEVLQRMRADPRSFAFPLALFRDEESLPAFLDWLEEECLKVQNVLTPLFAIDRIGSSAAADRLFAIGCTSDWAARQCLLELAKLDRPSNLPRLAALCARHPGREGFFYWRAFLVLLGRRD